jgi:hypothetical protein
MKKLIVTYRVLCFHFSSLVPVDLGYSYFG